MNPASGDDATLAGCAFLVRDPRDLDAARRALDGADLIGTVDEARAGPATTYNLDVLILMRSGSLEDREAARGLKAALGRDPHSFQAVELPRWDVGMPLETWMASRPGALATPGALGVWLQSLPAAPLAEDAEPHEDDEPPIEAPPWPAPLRAEALHGPIGEIVQDIAPETEADPVGLLVTLLIGLGNMIGRGPHVRVGRARHHANQFAVLVGETSAARKGTSLTECRDLWTRADPDWSRTRILNGLSSGEGVIHAVRDPSYGRDKSGATIVLDDGVADKRLLITEAEFGRVLAVQAREGNTLSAILRDAWDGLDLRTLTRRDGLTATAPHVGIVAHITMAELRDRLTKSDTFNGFSNRFLWTCVRRARLLPFGGHVPDETRLRHERLLAAILEHARPDREAAIIAGGGPPPTDRALEWTDEARAVWEVGYPRLTAPRPGAFGGATSRAEAHTLRLAVTYAVADRSWVLRPEHLRAALAVWDYCQDSARCIFGDRTGHATADRILDALRRAHPGGLTRTEIRVDVLGKHATSAEIAEALGMLQQHGQACCKKTATGGRPVEVWCAISAKSGEKPPAGDLFTAFGAFGAGSNEKSDGPPELVELIL